MIPGYDSEIFYESLHLPSCYYLFPYIWLQMHIDYLH